MTPQPQVVQEPKQSNILWWVSLEVLGLIFLFALIPHTTGHPPPSPRHASANQLQQIGLALQNYAARHGDLPPLAIYDDQGRAMHSWRVLILQELEEVALYEAYDFEKPWDHPENLKVAQRMPAFYQSPYTAPPGTTTYARLLGEGVPLLIDHHTRPVPWTQPVDTSPESVLQDWDQLLATPQGGFFVVNEVGWLAFMTPNHNRTEVEEALFPGK